MTSKRRYAPASTPPEVGAAGGEEDTRVADPPVEEVEVPMAYNDKVLGGSQMTVITVINKCGTQQQRDVGHYDYD